MDLSPFLHKALYPILVASQTVQILAIAPLLIIWFGFGLIPKVIIVILICFFPLAVSTADGLASADPDLLALVRAMGAKRSQIWRICPASRSTAVLFFRLARCRHLFCCWRNDWGMGGWIGGSGIVHAPFKERFGHRPGFCRHRCDLRYQHWLV